MTRSNPRVQPPTVQVWRLYRFYGFDGRLLYIGQTGRIPVARLIEHLYEQAWAHEIARWDVDPQVWHSEADVLAAERAAIRAEKPRYNWQGNEGNPDRVWMPKVGKYRHPGRRPAPEGPSLVKTVLLSPWMHWLLAWAVLLLAAWFGLGWASDKVGQHLTAGVRFELPVVLATAGTSWFWWRLRGRRMWRRWKRRR